MPTIKTAVRWIGVLPAAIILPCIGGFALYLVTFPISFLDFLGEWVSLARWFLLNAALAFCWPMWFVMAGTMTAPSRKTTTAFILGFIMAFLIWFGVHESAFETDPELKIRSWQIALSVLGLVVGVVIMWRDARIDKEPEEREKDPHPAINE